VDRLERMEEVADLERRNGTPPRGPDRP